MTPIRRPVAADLDALARLWFDVYQESHAELVPAPLLALRTVSDFRRRLEDLIDDLRVGGPEGAPLGFCAIRDQEIYQLFVAPAGRGTGLAVALLADGEARLAEAGVKRAHLVVAMGNTRAEKFYARCGWSDMGERVEDMDTHAGPFPLRVTMFEKDL